MNLGEQLEVFDTSASEVFDKMLEEIENRKDEIIELGRDRLIDGWELYGDTMWQWDDWTRDQNFLEEIADGLVYKVSEQDE